MGLVGFIQVLKASSLTPAGNNNLLPPALAMRGAVQPNQGPLPNGRIDGLVKVAEDIVQKASKQLKKSFPSYLPTVTVHRLVFRLAYCPRTSTFRNTSRIRSKW